MEEKRIGVPFFFPGPLETGLDFREDADPGSFLSSAESKKFFLLPAEAPVREDEDDRFTSKAFLRKRGGCEEVAEVEPES